VRINNGKILKYVNMPMCNIQLPKILILKIETIVEASWGGE